MPSLYGPILILLGSEKCPYMHKTAEQFDQVIEMCRSLFLKKMKDYGSSWRILRPISVTDQLYIKAQRLQSIEMKGSQKIEDDQTAEFIGLVNYGIIGLIQLELGLGGESELNEDQAVVLYNDKAALAKNLMLNKNHDYGEAWREMRISSYTDLILMKLYRIKQIEDNAGQTTVSEGIDANYLDIINYAIFALIKLEIEQ